MTDNTLLKLNDVLFDQLDRLNTIDVKNKEELDNEIARSNAVTDTAVQIISNANTLIRAKKLKDDNLRADSKLPKMLDYDDEQ